MSWFKDQRLNWIRESVTIYGFINRDHVKKKFDISTPQASIDIKDAVAKWPLLMKYNTSAKRYELI